GSPSDASDGKPPVIPGRPPRTVPPHRFRRTVPTAPLDGAVAPRHLEQIDPLTDGEMFGQGTGTDTTDPLTDATLRQTRHRVDDHPRQTAPPSGEHPLHQILITATIGGIHERTPAAGDGQQPAVHTRTRTERRGRHTANEREVVPRPPLGGHHRRPAHPGAATS